MARVAFAADCGGPAGSKTPNVAAAIGAAFTRFANPSATYLVIGGDEYAWCNAATMKHYDKFLKTKGVAAARTVMTPGNHTNGVGATGSGNAQDWLDYNRLKGTLSRTDGGWIDQVRGIPLTDQYLDIAGIRFVFINSGAVANTKAGWPVPLSGGSVAGDPRVAWLRSVWAPGTANVVITHHARWSYYGTHFDNLTMQNLIDETLGKNDGSGPHSSLIVQGHDHSMQLMLPQLASGAYSGLTSAVIGLCSTAPATKTAGAKNTSKKTWVQFANFSPGASGFLQIDIMDDRSLQLSIIDAANTSGALMTNTASTGITGSPTATIPTN